MRPVTRLAATIATLLLLFSSPSLSSDDAALVGTWKLVKLMNVVDGKEVHPFGEKPNGLFIYSAEGRLMIQIQRETPPESWEPLKIEPGGFSSGTPWYVGYFGRWSADDDVITHHVEGGTLLHYIGTDQKRPYSLDGDRLFIGERGAWERELVRVK